MADPNPNSPLLPVFLKLNCSDLSSRAVVLNPGSIKL